MCVVSMITDEYMRKWPYIPTTDPWWTPKPVITPEEHDWFKQLIKKAEEYDKRTGQPDCPDPEKVKWRKWLDEYMKEKYPYLKPLEVDNSKVVPMTA